MEGPSGGGIDSRVHNDRDVDHRRGGGESDGEGTNAAGVCVAQCAGNSARQYKPGLRRVRAAAAKVNYGGDDAGEFCWSERKLKAPYVLVC
jgi:hypothetical protein